MSQNVKQQSLRETAVLFAKGFVMGSADVVPGVSGGTMALILGIYERLIHSIRCINGRTIPLFFRLRWRDFFAEVPWRFLLTVALGILSAVFTLARPLEWLLTNTPQYVWAFFFGLVLASIFFIKKGITKWSGAAYILLFFGAVMGWWITGLLPAQTPDTLLFFFVSGVIAICAMILPGISGSFLLVVMGKYEQVLHAVNERNFVILIVFTAGTIVGIISFAKLLSWLLKHYRDFTMAFLIGLMVGSLRKIWPWQIQGDMMFPSFSNGTDWQYFFLILSGLAIVVVLEKLTAKSEPPQKTAKDIL